MKYMRDSSPKKNQMGILAHKIAMFKMEKFTGWALKKRAIKITQFERQRGKQSLSNLTVVILFLSSWSLSYWSHTFNFSLCYNPDIILLFFFN